MLLIMKLMFYLERIYMRLNLKSNMPESNLVHGEFSVTFANVINFNLISLRVK